MVSEPRRILPLSHPTRTHIRSTLQISSLTQVVLELVKNSLDANSDSIRVCLDARKGYCAIWDNGHGILKEEFLEQGGLARLYYTSKERQPSRSYGRHGRFLALLSGVSLLSITSCHQCSDSVNSILLTGGKRIASSFDITDDDFSKSKHGTRITVHNLFGQMPVRVRERAMRLDGHLDIEKEFNSLRNALVGILLATPQAFSLEVREGPFRYVHKPAALNYSTGQQGILNLNFVTSTLYQAGLIDSPSRDGWQQTSFWSPAVSIRAGFSTKPALSKCTQFISLGQQPLLPHVSNVLFDQVNDHFARSSFGSDRDMILGANSREKRSSAIRISKVGPKLWPMFCIHIDMDNMRSCPDIMDGSNIKLIETITTGLQSLIIEFLCSNGFSDHGIKKTVPPKRQPVKRSSSSDRLRQFRNWSRMKSGHGLSSDVLHGLPFTGPVELQGIDSLPVLSAEPLVLNQTSSATDSIAWTNPRTSRPLHVNSRTGMIIPPKNVASVGSITSSTLASNDARGLADVAEHLEKYIAPTDLEQPIKSVTYHEDAQFDHRWPSGMNVCTCEMAHGKSIHMGGNNSGELASSSITKDDLRSAKVLGQVDGKFIIASIVAANVCETTLILVDQHAADERVKLEELFQSLCNNISVPLSAPITFEVGHQEAIYFRQSQASFASMAIYYCVSGLRVQVSALPEPIVQKCGLEPQVLIKILRTEVGRCRKEQHLINRGAHWLQRIGAYPRGIIDLVISRACRSAIMFNDRLTQEQCKELVSQMCNCLFPFQCAHGRPSVIVLARWHDIDLDSSPRVKESSFGKGWRGWMK